MSKLVEEDDTAVNPSREPGIAELIEARMSRRTALKSVAAAGAMGLFGCVSPALRPRVGTGDTPLTFTESGRFLDETTHVAPGYDVQVLIRWGDPIRRSGPAFRPGAQWPDEQEQQFGTENDFLAARLEFLDPRAAVCQPRESSGTSRLAGHDGERLRLEDDARALRSPDGRARPHDRRDRENRQQVGPGG
jgi:secreted PhoX family phosphatase